MAKLALICAGCLSTYASVGDTNAQSGAKTNVLAMVPTPEALRVAESRARQVFGQQKSAYSVTLRQLKEPEVMRFLGRNWAFEAYASFQLPPAHCTVVVSRSGKAYAMPEDFGEVMVGEGLNGSTAKDFPTVVNLFAILAAHGRLVKSANDIPWKGSIGKNPANYAGDISSPALVSGVDGAKAQFCTWTPLGGVLQYWELQIGFSKVAIVKKRRVDWGIGSFQVAQ
jgi:hypothetical protein